MAGASATRRSTTTCRCAMAELSLLPAVRDADDDTLIVADGTSCRHQIADGTRATGRARSRARDPRARARARARAASPRKRASRPLARCARRTAARVAPMTMRTTRDCARHARALRRAGARRSGKARAITTCARTSMRCCRASKRAPPFTILDFGCGPGRDLRDVRGARPRRDRPRRRARTSSRWRANAAAARCGSRISCSSTLPDGALRRHVRQRVAASTCPSAALPRVLRRTSSRR